MQRTAIRPIMYVVLSKIVLLMNSYVIAYFLAQNGSLFLMSRIVALFVVIGAAVYIQKKLTSLPIVEILMWPVLFGLCWYDQTWIAVLLATLFMIIMMSAERQLTHVLGRTRTPQILYILLSAIPLIVIIVLPPTITVPTVLLYIVTTLVAWMVKKQNGSLPSAPVWFQLPIALFFMAPSIAFIWHGVDLSTVAVHDMTLFGLVIGFYEAGSYILLQFLITSAART